jgi:hypothetical protein
MLDAKLNTCRDVECCNTCSTSVICPFEISKREKFDQHLDKQNEDIWSYFVGPGTIWLMIVKSNVGAYILMVPI